jgi:RimJ/RimL family protein N-acetyltransferase
MIVETPRLRIRELTVDDAEFVFELVDEPSFLENIGDKGVRNVEDARQFILAGPWASHRERGYGQFLVELKEGGDSIGVCGLLFRESLNVSDIGCAFLPQYWRRGFAYEAACAVMEYGRSTLGIETIAGLTSEENLASIRMLEKLGMKFDRIVRMSDDDPGTALYS